MTISDPDVAAWTRGREERGVAELLNFMEPIRSVYRVRDLEAAAELVYYAAEEVSHRAVLFESPVGEERLVLGLLDMVTRYLFRVIDRSQLSGQRARPRSLLLSRQHTLTPRSGLENDS